MLPGPAHLDRCARRPLRTSAPAHLGPYAPRPLRTSTPTHLGPCASRAVLSFRAAEESGEGVLTAAEIAAALRQQQLEAPSDMDALWACADLDGVGHVTQVHVVPSYLENFTRKGSFHMHRHGATSVRRRRRARSSSPLLEARTGPRRMTFHNLPHEHAS